MDDDSAAPLFAALGDETRLSLVKTLSEGEARSISQLSQGFHVSRQAITKHLRVLEKAGMVRAIRRGREQLFSLDTAPLYRIKSYVELVSEQWDRTLARFKAFVEGGDPSP